MIFTTDNGAFSIASKNDLDDQNLLLATVHNAKSSTICLDLGKTDKCSNFIYEFILYLINLLICSLLNKLGELFIIKNTK
jgi:hypothetical protein